jgi:peptide-methionine (R)-S-oxide reductase
MRPTPPLSLLAAFAVAVILADAPSSAAVPSKKGAARAANETIVKITKTDQEWKKQLTPEQYRVLRTAGTETAFTGKYWNNHAAGIYRCAGCGLELFDSSTKFESGTGWPSFWTAIPGHVVEHTDMSLGIARVEVACARCGGHLGHVFDDGPRPTGLRYCMNSAALDFQPKK